MAFIQYHSNVDAADEVPDQDNILRIHAVHGRVMKLHYELYVELMRGPGPLTTAQRELVGVAVSAINQCHY